MASVPPSLLACVRLTDRASAAATPRTRHYPTFLRAEAARQLHALVRLLLSNELARKRHINSRDVPDAAAIAQDRLFSLVVRKVVALLLCAWNTCSASGLFGRMSESLVNWVICRSTSYGVDPTSFDQTTAALASYAASSEDPGAEAGSSQAPRATVEDTSETSLLFTIVAKRSAARSSLAPRSCLTKPLMTLVSK